MADEQVKPLTVASPPPAHAYNHEIPVAFRSPQYLRKRRCAIWCCGCCGATVVVLGFLILVLVLTVFKVKDPVLTLDTLKLDGVDAGFGSVERQLALTVNATLTVGISIKNPNAVGFRYDKSTTEFYYEGETVGVAYAPYGRVGARRTTRMNVSVDVLADRLAGKSGNLTAGLLAGGSVDFGSYTDLTGRVNVLGVYKKHLEVKMNCTLSLSLSNGQGALKEKSCKATVVK